MWALLGPLRVVSPRPAASRCCSGYVSRMRFLDRLKRDDGACLEALRDGSVLLFHRLRPLLRAEGGAVRPVAMATPELQSVLLRSGSDGSLLNESVLIGCSQQNQAQFCLDVGELEEASIAGECGGAFTDLRKAFFLLPGPKAPLVAKAQALLRWHQTHRFCSSSGQPTQKNQAGSQRTSGATVHYPQQMAPVVIVLVSDGTRCLLGRQASFPPGLYSALAGFCDMGQYPPALTGPNQSRPGPNRVQTSPNQPKLVPTGPNLFPPILTGPNRSTRVQTGSKPGPDRFPQGQTGPDGSSVTDPPKIRVHQRFSH
ncbi:NAD(P)H pyrophosphatase NUDT13, mitochondrial isoform 10-T10 [Menidia menidia]